MDRRLEGKIAFVTGAGSGIGRAITLAFVAHGAVVVATDIDESALADLRDDRPEAIDTYVVDVTDAPAMADVIETVAARHGHLDIVVANAGRGAYGSIVDMAVDEWRSIIDLCLTGVFITLRATGPILADGGSIITIASLNATQPSAGMSAYCAAKAGAVALTEVAAMEFGHRRIRANTIAPGLVRTAASGAFWDLPGVVEEFVDNTTLGRFAEVDDIASVAVFLASDESGFVSASLYRVDGGASTKRYPDLPAAMARLSSDAAAGD